MSKKTNIAIVEDNKINLRLFVDILELNGFIAHPLHDGHTAFNKIIAIIPELILMDVQLNHISGLDIVKMLKNNEQTKSIPVIAVTAFSSKYDEERIIKAGCKECISKPISIDPFLRIIRKYLQI